MSNESIDPVERELERALAGLRPHQPNVSREALMFRAGQASMRRRSRAWAGVAMILGVILTGTWAVRLLPAGGSVLDRNPSGQGSSFVAAYSSQGEHYKLSPSSYFLARKRVLENGLDAMVIRDADLDVKSSGAPVEKRLESPWLRGRFSGTGQDQMI